MAALLQPVGVCSEYLNPLRVATFLGPVSKRTLTYVRELADSDLKQKVRIEPLYLKILKICCKKCIDMCGSAMCVVVNSFGLNMLNKDKFNRRL